MSDLERLLDLQERLTSLQFEVMRFCEFVHNKGKGNDIEIFEFENPYLKEAFDTIKKHATWNKDREDKGE